MKSMKRSNMIWQIILTIFFSVTCALVLYPFLLLVGVSFSDERDIALYGYSLIPRNFSLAGYEYIFKNPASILAAYKTTIIQATAATFGRVMFCAMCAYPLSKRDLPARAGIAFYLYFTTLFGN